MKLFGKKKCFGDQNSQNVVMAECLMLPLNIKGYFVGTSKS